LVAGGYASATVPSTWLLSFSLFVFLSLALVKRCSELHAMVVEGSDAARGRDYRSSDRPLLEAAGVGSAFAAVVVLALFIQDAARQPRFITPDLLWLVPPLMLYWLLRLWVKTGRGQMDDDPIVFTVRDRGSRVIAALAVSSFVASMLPLPWP